LKPKPSKASMSRSFRSLRSNGTGARFGGGFSLTQFQAAVVPRFRVSRIALIGKRLILIAALLFVLRPAPARSQAEAIKLRKDNFHVLSAQMKDIVQGLGNGLPVSAMQNSVAVADQALRRLPSMFPAGSDIGDTKALPAIWAKPDRFKATYEDALARMSDLVAAAALSDRSEFGAAVGRMSAACGTCHAAFRAE
jgi:cytochrome c556